MWGLAEIDLLLIAWKSKLRLDSLMMISDKLWMIDDTSRIACDTSRIICDTPRMIGDISWIIGDYVGNSNPYKSDPTIQS